MKWQLLIGLLALSTGSVGQPLPVPEKLVYELTNSILSELKPQTWYKRAADGSYRWHKPAPDTAPEVRLLLRDRLDATWCRGLMCSFSPADSVQYEPQLLRYFSPADLAYMRQQLPAAARFVFRQAKIRPFWVHVVPLDTIQALRQRLGWRGRSQLGYLLAQRYGAPDTYHISRIVFTIDQRRALVTMGSDYNGYTVSVYHKVGAAWRWQQELVMVEY